MTPEDLLANRFLPIKDVQKIWPVSRQTIWRACNEKSEANRLPSYKLPRGSRLIKFDELIWYMDKHRFTPEKTLTNKTREAAE